MVMMETVREALGQRDHEGIARMAGGHHQVGGEGPRRRCRAPTWRSCIDYPGLGTQPGVPTRSMPPDAVESQVQRLANRPQVPSTITTAIARLTSGSSQPQPNCR